MFEFKLILLTCLLGHLLQGSESIFRRRQFANPVKIDAQRKDYGEPVFLTPLIQAGQIKEARIRSLVTGLPGLPKASQMENYSGFITVNPKANGNLFFWFFPAKDPNAPVMVWLQGGPGGSSLYGLFAEHGPLEITQNLTANIREFAWTNVASMIYIDNPVGTGFSFVDNEDGYVTNEVQVGNDLFEFLRQFFIVFNEYKGNEFYVTGESYAGKYVPAIGYRIHKNNSIGLNFKGIAVGDGLCDPENMFAYGNYLYQVGLLDEKQRNYFRSEEEKAVYYIKNGQYLEAFRTFDSLLNGDLLTTPSAFTNFTGSTNYFNFLYSGNYVPEYYNQYLALAETRRAIHVGNLTYNDGSAVEKHLLNDVMQSVRPWVGVLMDNYKVLMYSGQLDIIVAAPLTESFLRKVEWKGSKDYRRASRSIWKVSPSDSEVAGYVRRVGDFRQVIVRKAGHMVPYDQPRAALDMIQRFINNKL